MAKKKDAAAAPPPAGTAPAVLDEQIQALAAQFDAGEMKWKPQTVNGNRALVICYVDARVIMDRLDDVVGVDGWQDRYVCLPDGAVVCKLRVKLGGRWITKEDVGGQSEQPDEGDRRKAAFSDALKRAAVKFGIGRYIYRLKPQWMDYDPQKRQIVGTPRLPGGPAPAQQAKQAAPAPQQAAPAKDKPAKAMPESGRELLARLEAKEKALEAAGLCEAGELVQHIKEAGGHYGHPKDITLWDEKGIALAVDEVKKFEAGARRAADAPAQPPQPAEEVYEKGECVTNAEYETLARLVRETKTAIQAFCKHFGAKGLFTFPRAMYAKAVEMLNEKLRRMAQKGAAS